MPTIVVLFNLKPGASEADYLQWAREKDIPTVRSMKHSVADFRVLKMGNLLGTEIASPYQYCELIEVSDMQQFFQDIQSPAVQEGSKVFASFADNPQFIVASDI
jgi:hypothetical protein